MEIHGARDRRSEEVASLLFGFETDLYPSLYCIPMAARYKLDVAGIKVSLKAWNRLPAERRMELLHAWPVDTAAERQALRDALCEWLPAVSDEPLRSVTLEEPPPWRITTRLCAAVEEHGAPCRPPLTLEDWASFDLLERFALVKLATAKHERGRFARALAEFRERRAGRPLTEARL
jgi:hypothetical protein